MIKKILALILNFFRSIFKKKKVIGVGEIKPDKKAIRKKYLKKQRAEKEARRKTWQTPAETRSLLKQLHPGDQVFDEAGNPMAIYRVINRRKIGVLVEDESGQRWKLHFMGLQSRTFSPDLP